jgi:hypothetical protein
MMLDQRALDHLALGAVEVEIFGWPNRKPGQRHAVTGVAARQREILER